MKKLMKFAAVAAAICLVLLIFSVSISRLEQGQHREDKQILEEALRRTAVACYASEGFYPPNVSYMQQHYGLQFDESRFTVRYEIFASNLMPDITVLDK